MNIIYNAIAIHKYYAKLLAFSIFLLGGYFVTLLRISYSSPLFYVWRLLGQVMGKPVTHDCAIYSIKLYTRILQYTCMTL